MSSRRVLWGAVLFIAVVAAGWLYWERGRSKAALAGPIRLAAIPFANLTGDPDWDGAAAAMPAAVLRQMQGGARVRAFGALDANQAAALGATHLLEGYLAPGRDGVRAHYVLTRGSRSTLERSSIEALSKGGPASAVQLASRIHRKLELGGDLVPLDLTSSAAYRHAGAALLETEARRRMDHWRAAVEAEPGCGWCWEELASHVARLEGREAGLALLAGLKGRSVALSDLAGRRLRLLEASLGDKPAERLAAFESLAELTPGDPDVLIPMGEALVATGRCLDGAIVYERAYALDPGRPEVLNSAGYALAWAGRIDEALSALQRYELADPQSANPRDSMGEVLMMAGRFAEAEEAFLASHELDPRFNGGAALQKAALVRWLNGDAREAGVLLEKYLKQRAMEGDPFAALRRARWQYIFGQTAEALANLRQLASQPALPASSLAASTLSFYTMQAGRQEEAAQLAAQAQQLARDSLSRYAAHAAMIVSAVEPQSEPGNDQNHRIWEALRLTFRRQFDAAEKQWRDALAGATPLSAALAREMLAQVLLAKGDPSAAAQTAGSGWPLLAQDHAFLLDFVVYPNLLCVRAAAAAEESQPEKARRFYEQFLRYVGTRPDLLGLAERARAASRL